MNVAELFVKLGVEGNTKVGHALESVQTGLSKTRELSLAAQASILGLIYGVERLTEASTGLGMDLKNFGLATGLSTQELQRWQYAALQAGVTADEMAGTIKGLQKITVDMMLGKGIPDGLALLGITPSRNPFNTLVQIQEKIRGMPADVARTLVAGLGISDGVFAMLRNGSVGLSKFRQELALTNAEQNRLTKVNQAWSDFWFTFKQNWAKTVGDAEVSKGLIEFATVLKDASLLLMDAFKAMERVFVSIDLDSKIKGLRELFHPSNSGDGRKTFGPLPADGKGSEQDQYRENMKGILPGIWKFLTTSSLDLPQYKNMQTDPAASAKEQAEYREAFVNALPAFWNWFTANSLDKGQGGQTVNNNITHTTTVNGNVDKEVHDRMIKQSDVTNAYFQSPALNRK